MAKKKKYKKSSKSSSNIQKKMKNLCKVGFVIIGIAILILLVSPTARAYANEDYNLAVNAIANYRKNYAPKYNKDIPLNSDYYYGIDVSYYQGNIDWEDVKIEIGPDKALPISFAYLRATQGITITDRKFKRNRRRTPKAEIPTGAYHYFSLVSDPAEQAKCFIKIADLEAGDLRPVLDFEEHSSSITTEDMQKKALIWLDAVEKHYHCIPIIYTNKWLFQKLFNNDKFKKYDFWIANYSQNMPDLGQTIWQFSECGYVKGVNHITDLNIVKSKEDFKRLFIQTE